MKKILSFLLVVILLISFTGCINSKKNNSSSNTIEDKTNDLELYSDDTKYVFQNDNTIHVFYYEDDIITGYTSYVDYKSEELAKYAYDALEEDNVKDTKNYYVKGKYLVFEWNESEYSSLTVSNLHKTYQYMNELKKDKRD